MNNIQIIFSLISGIILVVSAVSFAQEQVDSAPTVKRIQELFQERDPLAETLNQVGALKDDFDSNQMGVDKESGDLVRTLKNPFIPKLPVVKQESIEKNQASSEIISIKPETSSSEETVTIPTMVMAGLVWNSDRPQAIINGHVVNVGDRVDAWTIVNISKQGVEISLEGRSYLLSPPNASAAANLQNQHQ